MRNGLILYKMSGSGNDFVFADGRLLPVSAWSPEEIRRLCARGTGIGADGFVVLEKGRAADAMHFHYFNSDGIRAALCGNAALCATRLASWLGLAPAEGMRLETDSGTLRTRCLPGEGERAEIDVPVPSGMGSPEIALAAGEQSLHFTTVGVPHLVVLVKNLESVPVRQRGRELREHPVVQPEGANANFLACDGPNWSMRTYERGVEDETLACGTGAVASAAVLAATGVVGLPWSVRTRSGSILTVSGTLDQNGGGILEPKLAGEGRLVFRAVLGV